MKTIHLLALVGLGLLGLSAYSAGQPAAQALNIPNYSPDAAAGGMPKSTPALQNNAVKNNEQPVSKELSPALNALPANTVQSAQITQDLVTTMPVQATPISFQSTVSTGAAVAMSTTPVAAIATQGFLPANPITTSSSMTLAQASAAAVSAAQAAGSRPGTVINPSVSNPAPSLALPTPTWTRQGVVTNPTR